MTVHHRLNFHEGAPLVDDPTGTIAPIVREEYVVLTPDGIFKRGHKHEQGDIIELDPATAERFITLGEVEPRGATRVQLNEENPR